MNILWIIILLFIFMIGVLGLIFYIIEEKDNMKVNKNMIQRISEEKHRELAMAKTKVIPRPINHNYSRTEENKQKEPIRVQKVSSKEPSRVRGTNNNSSSNSQNFYDGNMHNTMYSRSSIISDSDYGSISSKVNNDCSRDSYSGDSSSSSSCND